VRGPVWRQPAPPPASVNALHAAGAALGEVRVPGPSMRQKNAAGLRRMRAQPSYVLMCARPPQTATADGEQVQTCGM